MRKTEEITRDVVDERDRTDPLRSVREEFQLPQDQIYLDGNSLGPMPKRAVARMRDVMEAEWGTYLISAWNQAGWFAKPWTVGDRIGRLIGAGAGQVVVADSTSVNLFKLICAAIRLRPGRKRVLTEAGNFPTDIYILQSACDLIPGMSLSLAADDEQLQGQMTDEVAVVVLTEVNFRTGKRHDMAAITRRAHEIGALIIWDLCHSVGAFPIDVDGCGADFAVGCTYKYLNGGPGSPAFVYVARRHQESAAQPLTGWIGHEAPFDFSNKYQPAPGVRRFLSGSPAVLSFIPLEASLDIWEKVDLTEVWAKSVRLTSLFINRIDQFAPTYNLTVASPQEATRRGSQVSLCHENAFAVIKALISKGVIGDFRTPNILRFGFTPLTLRYSDVWDAASILENVMSTEAWKNFTNVGDEVVT